MTRTAVGIVSVRQRADALDEEKKGRQYTDLEPNF